MPLKLIDCMGGIGSCVAEIVSLIRSQGVAYPPMALRACRIVAKISLSEGNGAVLREALTCQGLHPPNTPLLLHHPHSLYFTRSYPFTLVHSLFLVRPSCQRVAHKLMMPPLFADISHS